MAASEGFRFPDYNFIKKETPEKIFSCEFCKISKTIFSFDGIPPDDCLFCLSANFEKFFRTLLLSSTSGKLLFYVQVAEFQSDIVKNYFTGAFQAFYARSRSSHSKVFIYLKSQKIVCEGVNLFWSCEMPTCKLTKKDSFTHPPSYILPSFSQNASQLVLPKRLWKFESRISFWKCKRKVVLLVIYLFSYDSSKSIFFICWIMAFNVLVRFLLSAVVIK